MPSLLLPNLSTLAPDLETMIGRKTLNAIELEMAVAGDLLEEKGMDEAARKVRMRCDTCKHWKLDLDRSRPSVEHRLCSLGTDQVRVLSTSGAFWTSPRHFCAMWEGK